jgi:hypothetical protein
LTVLSAIFLFAVVAGAWFGASDAVAFASVVRP